MRSRAGVSGLLISLAVAAASVLLYARKPVLLETLDTVVQDSLLRLRGPVKGDGRIVIVAIDKRSISEEGKWPWPRVRIAELIRRIAGARPALIVLDFLFAEGDEGDAALAASIEDAGNVVVPFLFYLSRDEARHQTQGAIESGLEAVRAAEYNQVIETGPPSRLRNVYEACGIEAPVSRIAGSSRSSGFYNMLAEADGSFRSIPLVIWAQERPYAALSVSAAREFGRRKDAAVVIRGGMVERVTAAGASVSTDVRGCMALNPYGPPDVFSILSAVDVLQAREGSLEALVGRIVFVGGMSLGDFETRPLPLSPVAYSVQIQANAVDNILNGTYLKENWLSTSFALAAIIIPSLFMGLAIPHQRKASTGLLAAPCTVLCLIACDYLLLTRALIRTPVVYGICAAVGSHIFVSLHRFMSREREGRRLAYAVNAVTGAITSILDLDEILPRILSCLVEFIRAARGALLLYERGEGKDELKLSVKATVRMDTSLMEKEEFASQRALIAKAVEKGETILVRGRGARRSGAALCLPLMHRNRPLGLMYAEMDRMPSRMLDRHIPILNSFAAQAAVAIENARLHTYLLRREERLQSKYLQLKEEVERGQRFPFIIGASAAMQRLYDLIEKAIDSSITVLIQGETGTGKEVIARTIHQMGPRRERPFVAQNCASLPEALLESELFGHKRGAFTGAVADKKGLFEIADGGTIFLDEIAEMSAGTQAKLLRVLEGGLIRPLGDTREKKVDVRIISATNLDLAVQTKEKKFREDLFYRFNVFPIVAPPLRDRREDIPLLANHFLALYGRKLGKAVKGFSAEVMDLLMRHDYPGNVRELENEIERLVVLVAEGEMISPDLLSAKFREAGARAGEEFYIEQAVNLGEFMRAAERGYIHEVLRQCGGNKTVAAQRLGISRVTLHKKIRDYGLG